ncbi:MAG TPA: oxalate/formate MFS antiporter [Chloroflexota bacterium]|nr:oxalate/formate MFS antiporter [Chloroflexota bacterium]
MSTVSAPSQMTSGGLFRNRWWQLVVGILGMVMIANLQYGWTLFVGPIDNKYHWGRAAIQLAFTLFVLFETWLVPFEAYFVDRFGPRLVVGIGGLLVGIAWVMNSYAASLPALYAGAIIGGIGAGAVYGTCVGNALKWFPDHRGLAAGLTAAGFGMGSALTVVPIANMIQRQGYADAFFSFGIGQGIIVILAALVMRAPRPGELSLAQMAIHTAQTSRDYTPVETLRTPVFWLMYGMMTMVATGGLMAVAQLAPIATDFKVDKTIVSLGWITMAALPFALSLDRILNGLTRPFWGWVSDHIGRENTMFLAFGLEACAIVLLIQTASNPLLFVLFSAATFFGWGEIYSLFPATSSDLFGRRYATTNYGMLYTAKGTASLLVPVGNLVQGATGSWLPIFMLAVAFDVIAAILAITALKTLRKRHLAGSLIEPLGAVAPAMAGASH